MQHIKHPVCYAALTSAEYIQGTLAAFTGTDLTGDQSWLKPPFPKTH